MMPSLQSLRLHEVPESERAPPQWDHDINIAVGLERKTHADRASVGSNVGKYIIVLARGSDRRILPYAMRVSRTDAPDQARRG